MVMEWLFHVEFVFPLPFPVIRCSDSVTNCSIGSGVVENVGVAFGITLISQSSAEIGHAIKCDFQIIIIFSILQKNMWNYENFIMRVAPLKTWSSTASNTVDPIKIAPAVAEKSGFEFGGSFPPNYNIRALKIRCNSRVKSLVENSSFEFMNTLNNFNLSALLQGISCPLSAILCCVLQHKWQHSTMQDSGILGTWRYMTSHYSSPPR